MEKLSVILRKIALSLLIGIVPLLVWPKSIQLHSLKWSWYKGTFEYVDFFAYYKSVGIIAAAMLMTLAVFMGNIKDNMKKVKENKIFALGCAGVSVFILLSAFLTEYPNAVGKGYIEHSQGVGVWFSYVLLLFFVTFGWREEEKLWVERNLLISGLVIVVIGLFQALQIDFFKTGFGQIFLGGAALTDQINFVHGQNFVYSTLANSNYMGLYCAAILPLGIWKAKQATNMETWIWRLFTVLLVVGLVVSKSRGGFVGVALAGIVYALYFVLKRMRTKLDMKMIGLVSIALVVGVAAGLVWYVFVDEVPSSETVISVSSQGERVEIEFDTQRFYAVQDTQNASSVPFIIDENLNPIEVQVDDQNLFSLKISESQPLNYGYTSMEGYNVMFFQFEGFTWKYAITSNGFERLSPYGLLVTEEKAESLGFKGKEALGSARGYIWSRSLPLLKDSLIVGSGPDTFALEFPQHEYEMKHELYYTERIIVDKSHNIVLQMFIELGGLVAVTFCIYIISLLIRNGGFGKAKGWYLMLVSMMGAYMFSDMTVMTAPYFIIAAGIVTVYTRETC